MSDPFTMSIASKEGRFDAFEPKAGKLGVKKSPHRSIGQDLQKSAHGKPAAVKRGVKVSARSRSDRDAAQIDTVVVPAQRENFVKMAVKGKYWRSIRMRKDMRDQIQYIAFYRTHPISAITHYAPVSHIEDAPHNPAKSVLYLAEEVMPIRPIPKIAKIGLRQHRYTNLERMKAAKDIGGL